MHATPRVSRAAILVRQREPLVIDQVELPHELAPGQVEVQVYFSSICGSQLGEIDGVKGRDRYLPHLLGHEGSGRVVDVGPAVTRVKTGDHVVLHWRKASGIEAVTPTYDWNGGRLNAGPVTTFNEFAVISENRLTPIPKDFDLEIATLFGCAVTTGFGVITRDAGLALGQSLVVLGVGGVGLSVVMGASLVTAHPVIAVDRFDSRLDLATQLGATHAVTGPCASLGKVIRAILGADGADVVVDTTGDVEMIGLGYELTKPTGRTILVGVPAANRNASIATLPLHFGKVLTGSHGGSSEPHIDIPRYVNLQRAEKLSLQRLLTARYKLDEINSAIESMRSGETAGRCLLEITPTEKTGLRGITSLS